MSDGRSFFSRWSERKTGQRATEQPAEEIKPAETAMAEEEAKLPASADGAQSPSEETEAAVNVEDLPDIDTLDKDSDFTVFMRDGVPENLKKLALRKLWRSDPVLANLDGLNDYDEDFTYVGGIGEVLRTSYRPGHGYDDPDDAGEDMPDDEAEAEEIAEAESEVADADSEAPVSEVEESDSPEDEGPVSDAGQGDVADAGEEIYRIKVPDSGKAV